MVECIESPSPPLLKTNEELTHEMLAVIKCRASIFNIPFLHVFLKKKLHQFNITDFLKDTPVLCGTHFLALCSRDVLLMAECFKKLH